MTILINKYGTCIIDDNGKKILHGVYHNGDSWNKFSDTLFICGSGHIYDAFIEGDIVYYVKKFTKNNGVYLESQGSVPFVKLDIKTFMKNFTNRLIYDLEVGSYYIGRFNQDKMIKVDRKSSDGRYWLKCLGRDIEIINNGSWEIWFMV